MEQEVNLQSAQHAFNSFFSGGVKGKPDVGKQNPADKVLNKVKLNETPPDTVTKINTEQGPASRQEMSVDEAKQILKASESFDDLLKRLKIKPSELFEIIDMFLDKGYYQKAYRIKKFQFVLQSKKVYSIDVIVDSMDRSDLVTEAAITQMTLKHRLASSLVFFKLGNQEPRVFEHSNPADDAKVLEFIQNEVSSPIYSVLVNYLNKFDTLVGLASNSEAIDRFLAHSTD